MPEKSNGQIAYEAYSDQSDGKSLISGAPLLTWDDLHQDIKEAWEAAGGAVAVDRDQLWSLLHEAAGWIKSYRCGEGDQLYERISDALDQSAQHKED